MLCRGPAARPGCPPWVSPLGVSRDALRACSKVNESECTVEQALSFCFERQLCRRADALICRRCLRDLAHEVGEVEAPKVRVIGSVQGLASTRVVEKIAYRPDHSHPRRFASRPLPRCA